MPTDILLGKQTTNTNLYMLTHSHIDIVVIYIHIYRYMYINNYPHNFIMYRHMERESTD